MDDARRNAKTVGARSMVGGQLDPIAPVVAEAMPRAAVARRGPLGAVDAFIIAVLAYAALRPQELLALHWEDALTDVEKLFVARKNVERRAAPVPQERP